MSTIAPVVGRESSSTPAGSTPRPSVARLREVLNHPLLSYRLIIGTGAVLLVLGLLMVISSSSVTAAAETDDPYSYGKKQIMFAVFGLIGAVALALLPEKVLTIIAWPTLVLGILLITLAIFTPLGVEVSGNRNWIQLGPSWARFQPSEFAKVAIIIWGADNLARRRRYLTDVRKWLLYIAGTFLIVGLVLFQKDLGTALVMAAMVIVVMIAAGAPWRLLGVLGLASGLAVGMLVALKPNRLDRVWAFFHPEEDLLGLNLQPDRGLLALASGGWLGQGLGASHQKWGMLTGAHTDFIFAIIGEELGLLGTLLVVALFTILAVAGLRVAVRSTSEFSRLVAIGVVAWFTVQAFLNIAVAIRAFPVMGVTLPMISYGGSSLMANLFALGLLAGCARREPDAVRAYANRHRPSRRQRIVRAVT